MLNRVSLGHNHFQIALIFRDSMIVSKLVSSTETWYGVSDQHYKKLEEIDEMFMTKILELPQSVPKLSLYAECGRIPLRFVIQKKRLMFWWDIMHKDENELLFKFYSAQKLRPVKNDYVLQIKKDLGDIQWEISENEVKQMSKTKFKKIMENKVNGSARKYLENMKKSKTNHLKVVEKSAAAKYLFSKKLNLEEIRTLFWMRSRTISVKDNQKSSFKDNMWCRTCFLFSETQEHILQCSVLRDKVQHLSIDFSSVDYKLILSILENQE